ncbi:MAG TPA: proline dehydrogenase family protein [Solirubrobacteraceae bacterium]|nr:proline dehydrogenase family protein [Solirubrobacteraceae bacterium]
MPISIRQPLFALATSDRLEQVVRGLPGGEALAYRLASRYVAGVTAEDAFATARRLAERGVLSSIDYFGERVTDPAEAERVTEAYVSLAQRVGSEAPGAYLSVDLSHLAIDEDGVVGRLERIAAALPPDAYVQVGAEEAERADRILSTVLAVARGGGRVAVTLQANLRRSVSDASALVDAGVPVRLVKGAYVESPAVAHAFGEPTNLAFVSLAYALHRAGGVVWLATHDPVLREALLPGLPGAGVEMLFGVRPSDQVELAARGVPVRVYMPYGDQWFRYAMRRLAESRGAH